MIILDTNVSAAGQNSEAIRKNPNTELMRVQVSFDAGITGTVVIRARINPNLDWTDIATSTGDDIISLAYVEYIQAQFTASAGSGGSPRVKVGLSQ